MSKTKVFISAIPAQPKGQLKSPVYEPHGNSKLAYGETRFPIIPVINGYAESGDIVRVIAILTEGENFTHNFDEYFVPDIGNIAREKGLVFGGVETIRTADSEDIDTQLKLFGDIIGKVNDEEEIYACITYGTKPTPIVESMALSYAYRLKKGVSIGCIVYGRYFNYDPNGNNGIYDTTALFYMDSIVNKLAELKLQNPEAAIRAMLGIGGGEND